jgi:hypothetical protein
MIKVALAVAVMLVSYQIGLAFGNTVLPSAGM